MRGVGAKGRSGRDRQIRALDLGGRVGVVEADDVRADREVDECVCTLIVGEGGVLSLLTLKNDGDPHQRLPGPHVGHETTNAIPAISNHRDRASSRRNHA